ncbi:MAG: LCP family protein [Butyricicoccaceae bacterium]
MQNQSSGGKPPRTREERLRRYEEEAHAGRASKSPKPSRSSRRKKRGRKHPVLSAILVIILAVVVFLGVLGYKMFSSYEYDDTNDQSIADTVGPDGIMTVALFGVDTRSWSDTSRSDAIMVMAIDPQRGKIKLTSLMRDSYVEIPGYGKSKLCHAYAYGGPQLAMQTINENFGTNITEYATVNLEQISAIIDAMGGVTIDVSEAELEEANKHIANYCKENNIKNADSYQLTQAGEQNLNGLQAMVYGRIRKGNTGGDWQRTERQSLILQKLFSKISSANPIQCIRFMNALLPNMRSSLSTSDILYMGMHTISHGMPDMEHTRLPLDGEWSYATINGGSYITFNDDVLADHLHDYIYDDVKPVAEQ